MSNTDLFGMLSFYRDKRLKTFSAYRLAQKQFAVNDLLSPLPKNVCHQIFTQLNPVDKNRVQRSSKHWNAIGSKTIPNVYSLALCGPLRVMPQDLSFISFYVKYTKSILSDTDTEHVKKQYDKIIDNLQLANSDDNTHESNTEIFRWFRHLYSVKGNTIKLCSVLNLKFNYKTLEYKFDKDVSLNYDRDEKERHWQNEEIMNKYYKIEQEYAGPFDLHPLEIICCFGEFNSIISSTDVLKSIFAIAVKKNDFGVLKKLVHLSDHTSLDATSMLDISDYTSLDATSMLDIYVNVMQTALDESNQEVFEFLACNFPVKQGGINYFCITFDYYSDFITYFLTNNQNKIEKMMDDFGFQKDFAAKTHSLENILFCANPLLQYTRSSCFAAFVSLVVDSMDNLRIEKGWNTSAEIFNNQEENLDVFIKLPLLEALRDNDIAALKYLLEYIDKNQFFFNKRQRYENNGSLCSIHIDLLNTALSTQKKEAFFLLCCLRLQIINHIDDPYMKTLYHNYRKKMSDVMDPVKVKEAFKIEQSDLSAYSRFYRLFFKVEDLQIRQSLR